MKKYWDTEYYEQPSAATLRKGVKYTAQKAQKNGKVLSPVTISGRNIVQNWWGMAWCENLENYADYASRLERGRRYVRTGAVVDLQILKGKVTARVQGRRKTPYKIEIRISPLSEEDCQRIVSVCGHRIDNLDQLLAGEFPEELKQSFMNEACLFPTPREISFSCSCPDWALMCKHVAAVLYGIGNRFDRDPMLFFELRGIDVERLVDVSIENRIEKMLANVNVKSDRVIEEVSYEELFGIG